MICLLYTSNRNKIILQLYYLYDYQKDMYYGKVIGNIVSTIKVKNLDGQKIQIVRPIDMETGEPSEDFIVALDITSSGIGDYVGYEDGKEAAWAFEPKEVVTDATIVAIIDKVNIEKRKQKLKNLLSYYKRVNEMVLGKVIGTVVATQKDPSLMAVSYTHLQSC